VTDIPAFDLAGPLPTGTTVLEASAGTGKTWAISALAVRYLADGVVTAPKLLAITFTRLASADLRSRLYQRLIETTARLQSLRDGQPGDSQDELLDVLASGPDDEVSARLERLRQAISDFDAATVATIHEFCRRAADWLGPALGPDSARIDADAAAALASQTIADLTLDMQLRGGALTPDACAKLGRAGLAHPHLPVEPAGDQASLFIGRCRAEYARRKAAAGIDDFDDVALRLESALGDETTGSDFAEQMAARYRVVLVDEFQDTDPVQWEILRRAFAGRTPMVLVGDPKQAIYGFRDADIESYLDAVRHADTNMTLPVNHRSDEAVVRGVNEVFRDADFGHTGAPIPMRESRASHAHSRLDPAPGAGLEIRRVMAAGAGQPHAIECDVTAYVARLLATESRLQQDGRWRPLRADDIAVLVGTNKKGEAISRALQQAGVPAVFSGAASVFASTAADEWLTLLDALATPRVDTLRRAMAGQLVGLTLAQLADPAGTAASGWSARLREWAGARTRPLAILSALDQWADLSSRLLQMTGGERLLTDVRHLAELLARHSEATDDPAALAAWLRAQCSQAESSDAGDRTRRLETDRPAVSVLTIHAAKGLEFPVVLVPAAADAPRHTWGSPDYPMIRRDPGRVIDTSTSGPGTVERLKGWAAEQAGEDRRRLYAALTRGSSLVVAWLGDRNATLTELTADWTPGQHPDVRLVAVDETPVPPKAVPSPVNAPVLEASAFARQIDDTWVRTSYSGLTADLHGTVMPEADDGQDEMSDADEIALSQAGASPLLSPMDALPAGTAFGSVVHAVLEACDPASATLRDDLASSARRFAERSVLSDLDTDLLSDALVAVLHTPLGPLAGGVSLADLGASRRLVELGFELPLGDGDAGKAWQGDAGKVADLAALFGDRDLVPTDDLLAGYGDVLGRTGAADRLLRGFLTGSIDAIHELPDGRVFLIDYKTNRLGPIGAPDTVAAYGRRAMASAMMAAHYPLQALLYAVALRRYLRWRRPDACFDDQWAGVGYLFVRGMAGPHTPIDNGMPCGVFGWRPSAPMVQRADEILTASPGGAL